MRLYIPWSAVMRLRDPTTCQTRKVDIIWQSRRALRNLRSSQFYESSAPPSRPGKSKEIEKRKECATHLSLASSLSSEKVLSCHTFLLPFSHNAAGGQQDWRGKRTDPAAVCGAFKEGVWGDGDRSCLRTWTDYWARDVGVNWWRWWTIDGSKPCSLAHVG